MPVPDLTGLPVHAVLPTLAATLAAGRAAVLEAPPGAGKSTGVPLALLDEPWLAGRRIVMLEPRRLAARTVATRMASLLGEPVGDTVGYRLRLDTKVGPRTRLEVITEGILTRQLQRDPELEGVGLLIFDEFHERSLQADLGLALALDVREHLNPGLRLLVMSATLDGERVARLIGDADVLRASGQAFPVTTHHLGKTADRRDGSRSTDAAFIRTIADAVRRALEQDTGDVLVFLPGSGEIRRVAAALAPVPADVDVIALYGDLPQAEQDRAIRPAAAGRRKVVLATNIAETSLTIEGVHIVVDGGLERRPRFDPRSGMSRLETVRISAASADQRRGRAGRLGPGICYRCWDESVQRALPPHTPPEILEADLAPLALELAAWGVADAGTLRWLDPPPAGALAQARELLVLLGALDAAGRITPHGHAMTRLGAHPRLAHLMLGAKSAGLAATGCALAALLSERDILRSPRRTHDGAASAETDSNLLTRLELLAADEAASDDRIDRQAVTRVRRTARLYARQLGADSGQDIAVNEAGWLLATAWPGRVGRLRPGTGGRYQLSGGRGAFFARPEALAKAEFIVVPELDAGEREARIFLAASLTKAELERHLDAQIVTVDRIGWGAKEQAVLARRQRRLGELVLDDKALTDIDPSAIRDALLEGVRSLGLTALPWTDATRQWQARVQLLHRVEGGDWPDVGDEALLGTLEDWLAPWVDGLSRREHLARIDLAGALKALLDWNRQRLLDELAPLHLTVPSGSRITVDYLGADAPSLSVRLQEVFGLHETPRIAGGRVPVLMKLLSPARRPVQITRDLGSFWASGYHEVRRELKGRYPKHYWPENPHEAEATRRVRPR